MALPTLAIVGGFLGAGKTTLILQAARLLRGNGYKPAVILNDQDSGLVDTQHALAEQLLAREIADGCFCCRFSGFIAAAQDLAGFQPDVIFAEPVGSCTDIVATVIRPLQELCGDQLRIAPLTVLVNPASIESQLSGALGPDIEFLTRHQLAEADLVCTGRRDLYPEPPSLPFPVDFHLSGATGEGVQPWLEELLEPTHIVGARPLDIDYKRYAEAEAALGWLNLHARIHFCQPSLPALFCGPLLEEIDHALSQANIVLAHLKIFDRTPYGWLRASIYANGTEAAPEGDLLSDAAVDHELVLNLRALGPPEKLKHIVLEVLRRHRAEVHISHLAAFSPAAPQPEHRML